ncbi:MAG: adenylyl-sulfate kinase, partial [Alphaproteobacteria bacterium]|nr:adenylyl-sulfate kinase [Alphaproteobacteria bacterium]
MTASAGQSVALTLDQQIFVERGAVAHTPEAAPLAARRLRARLFWLAREPLEEGRALTLKIGTGQHPVTVSTIRTVLDFESLESRPSPRAARNEIAEVVLESDRPLPVDAHGDNAATGRGVLVSEYDVVGGCIILGEAEPAPELHAVAHQVDSAARAAAQSHSGGVIWLTGLSGAGKSTLAMDLEARLFGHGIRAFVLDGDNLRKRLSSDLGFAPEDRAENIRRTAEVARLFAEAGVGAGVAVISPLRAPPAPAPAQIGGGVHQVHVRGRRENR